MGDPRAAGEVPLRSAADLDWRSLRAHHPPTLVTALARLFGGGGRLAIKRGDLQGLGSFTPAEIDRLLEELAALGWLARAERLVCPGCGGTVSDPAPADGVCASCRNAFVDIGDPVTEVTFSRQDPLPRLVDWVLTLHGMNTRGDWQEQLSWQIARTYGRAVPVAVYKYGIVRPGVLFGFRQRQLRDQVAARLRVLSQEAAGAGYRPEPDVIAHSFGTWLLAHALDANDELRVGRVILAGSVLRPDFCWKKLIDRGQVEAVLNHCGSNDVPVAVTHYFIPRSGPAGRRGFDEPGPIDVGAPGFGHSTFFHRMPFSFEQVWKPFLEAADARGLAIPGAMPPPATPWRQSVFPLRAGIGRLAVVVVLASLLALVGGAFALGVGPLLNWVQGLL